MALQGKRREVPSVETIELVGGRLCLDFVNTLNREQGRGADERFSRFRDVLTWSVRLRVIDAAAAARLAELSEKCPREAAASLEEVQEFRETLWRLFVSPGPSDVGELGRATKDLPLPRLKLDRNAGLSIDPGRDLCGWLKAAVYGSALELLAMEDPARIKVCPAHGCGWLFLDSSPGNRRKWCSMKTCGNRQKARQHYKRARKT